MTSRIAIVSNPAAGRGRGARVTAHVVEAAGHDCPLFVSSHSGDERRAAEDALRGGADTIIAVGGDGTWSRVAQALLDAGADCRLAVIAAGTGNDFAKGIGAPATNVAESVRLAREGSEVSIDVLRVANDYCINVAGFGFDAHVLASIRPVPLLRGDALYIYSALRELFAYRGFEIDAGAGFRNHLLLAICNGPRFGGQFHIAPAARMDDGLAQVIAVQDVPPVARIGLFAAVIGGRHTSRPDVAESTIAQTTLRFRTPPVYEIDGELRRASVTELDVRVLPRALRVVTNASTFASRPAPAAP